MDSGSPDLLDVLFERREDPFPTSAFSGADPRLSFPLQDHAYGCISEKTCETWVPSREQVQNDSDPEDLLQMFINPNEVYSSRSPLASPESDSGISDDPCADTPLQNEAVSLDLSPRAIYEVICDSGLMEGETLPANIFSSHLGNWSPPIMLPEACITSEISPALFQNIMQPSTAETSKDQGSFLQHHHLDFFLTDEERRLLTQEGVSVQGNLPLTKAEERVLKKVRRKIRNKQSAQDSRRRKKEYIDGLESRVAAYSAQNQELQKKLQELQTHNVSLVSQLQRLQGLIKQTSTKAAQTRTCLVILIFSLGLLILPSCSSLLGGTQISQEEYRPSGVISRTILTEGGLSDPEEPPGADEPEPPLLETGPLWKSSGDPDPGSGEKGVWESTGQGPPGLLGNSETEPAEGLPAEAEKPVPERDPTKQLHADEM
ncbi:PREDICTED: cyclic AMP-responsive element-binding protein 3-like protein 4 [Gekko japonicus]|uniref:Cyclic AMP-responsive element-binding protein 3-like protein 4 n=1 Tax=Gekko japonicus TaxID=146911 RepID=A0ABM1K0G8_GEKJA|nr:PREDICTED: cyclic AMP-responsive element-binding protein 3-like protein 4 [Gekko japonicus]